MLVLVASCGGGSTEIHETDSGLRPARRYLDKLEALATRSERETYLLSLRGHEGLDLNWAEFWDILDSSPKKSTLLNENQESLLGLHSLDCRPSFYKSYIRFILLNVDNGIYVYGPENRCALPVGPETWGAVIQRYFTDSLPPSQHTLAFEWLARELDVSNAVQTWQVALSPEAIANLRGTYDRLLDHGHFKLAVIVDEGFERKFNWSPVRSNLHLYLLRDSSSGRLLDQLSTSFLVSYIDFELERFSDVSIEKRLKPILHQIVRMHRGTASEFVDKVLALTTVASRLRLPSDGLRYTNMLQVLALEWIRERSESERREILSGCLAHLETSLAPAHRLHLLWLSLQLSDFLNALEHRTYLSNAAYQEDGEDILLPHRVLRQRMRMQYAPISSVGGEARAYCRMLVRSGFPERSISAAKLPSIVASLEAGCIFIKPSGERISVRDDITLPLDSLLILPNQDIEVVSRRFDVGMVMNGALFDGPSEVENSKSLTLSVEGATEFPVFGFAVSRNDFSGGN